MILKQKYRIMSGKDKAFKNREKEVEEMKEEVKKEVPKNKSKSKK